MGSACARQSLDPVRPATRRYEGYSQRQDKTAGVFSPLRPISACGSRWRVVRRGCRRPSTGVNQTTTNHQYHSHKVAAFCVLGDTTSKSMVLLILLQQLLEGCGHSYPVR